MELENGESLFKTMILLANLIQKFYSGFTYLHIEGFDLCIESLTSLTDPLKKSLYIIYNIGTVSYTHLTLPTILLV